MTTKPHGNKGRKQTPEQVRKRIESTAKTKSAWTPEQHEAFSNKIREAVLRRDPEKQKSFIYSNIGRTPHNKGQKMPQYSGEKHWNWGNQMSQESIEKMRQSMIGIKQSPKVIKKRFDSRAGYKHSCDTKLKISMANKGENNGMWEGGISQEEYPAIWWDRNFKESIRDRDQRQCQMCGIGENGKRLDVHHIDYDKKNTNPLNLISLCHKCHGKTNYNRAQWQSFFNKQTINKPDNSGIRKDKIK